MNVGRVGGRRREGETGGGGGVRGDAKRRREEKEEEEEEEESDDHSDGSEDDGSDDDEEEDGEDDDDDDDGEESASESELDLKLADDGRVWCPALPHLAHDTFRTFPRLIPGLPGGTCAGAGGGSAANTASTGSSGGDGEVGEWKKEALLARMVSDCRAVFTARAAASKSQYSAGETFWLAADASPRCALEALARRIFELHTAEASAAAAAAAVAAAGAKPGGGGSGDVGNVTSSLHPFQPFDPSRSGAEWWTQVLDARDEIGLHWDKDYGLEGADLNVHPHVATVTYLCGEGAPTLMVRKTTPVYYSHSVEGPLGPPWEANAYLSWPAPGKHVAFDGRWLHGAPTELAAATSGDGDASTAAPKQKDHRKQKRSQAGAGARAGARARAQPRVTFLVNVWLNHVPSTAAPLPADVAAAISQEPIPGESLLYPAAAEEDDVERVALSGGGGGGEGTVGDEGEEGGMEVERLRWTFKHGDGKHALEVDVPTQWLRGSGLGGGRSVALVGGGGRVAKVAKAPKPDKGGACKSKSTSKSTSTKNTIV